MHRRFDMLNKGDQWLWHLDPDYPRKLLSPAFFLPHGVDGLRLWYVCEMLTRAAYYRRLLHGKLGIYFHRLRLESLTDAESIQRFLGSIGVKIPIQKVVCPLKSNLSKGDNFRELEPISRLIESMTFEPEFIAAQYINNGYRLGVDLSQ